VASAYPFRPGLAAGDCFQAAGPVCSFADALYAGHSIADQMATMANNDQHLYSM